MDAIFFDTLQYSKKLMGGGFTQEQAETQAVALTEAIKSSVFSGEITVQFEEKLKRIKKNY
ncbi:MAG: hypothetical protein EVG15_02165 [Candidatus Acididesulfobacter diazotrophicus]|jgi:hypothetical protein|uniref:Uncharacterized protein n=1 Tax=Candidatus Acididesulfobacter diazotrophicus TaxID=2597226 RepID=A0A519BPR9_9DELT|nr:MAG: hypothetical protein EVG15_02165 [Candidatus Acididesulfobacter diazotrophicus]